MNIVIFSKDRACQLDLLLRSIRDLTNINFVSVIYAYSNPEYLKGYAELMNICSDYTEFIHEKDFKPQLVSCVYSDDPYTMFLTDDAVFKSEFIAGGLDLIFENEELACHSLFLGWNITWAYEEEREITQPKFTGSYAPTSSVHRWEWLGADIDFNYPMGVIGNIWRTSDILDKIKDLGYDKPWNVESALRDNPVDRPLMSGYEDSKVVHIANNVVSPCGNKSGGQSVEELNNKFLNDEQIKWEYINNNSVHFEWEYKFERMV